MRLFKLRGLPLAAALFVLFALTAPVLAASGQDKDTILIVAFGTSVEKARVSYENVEN